VVGALIVLTALPGLAACTPAARPLVAVRAVDGRPTALLAVCDDFRIDAVRIYPNSREASASPATGQRRLERVGSSVPESLDLFGPAPAGWSAAVTELSAMEPGQTYTLAASDQGVQAQAVPLFTLADLTALGPDEVLVRGDHLDHKKTTEKDFRDHAADSC
jgi:hypothetical protein